MGSPTQIYEIGLLIERKLFLRGDLFDNFRLIFFTKITEKQNRIISPHRFSFDNRPFFCEFCHPLFDTFKVALGKAWGVGKIIIKAVFNYRAYSHLGVGEKLFHGLRKQVGAGVPNNLKAFDVLSSNNANNRVLVDLKR